ncbi:MAG: type II toxin-antitoxin system RelE/ParE family toxin [Planctomycetes bacterium]|nr:type II toxin-antitoxin system RelE/ParE family toxin [Planctomycetota bacterium]MCC8117116.1 type II toxin-antitoxin system RelE/ParE family toxin [Planctomycetota bacterium]MCD7896546.1 type II toxin-antitoxin system RelE/ParE family toxin [Planctomycetaceae bacterium]
MPRYQIKALPAAEEDIANLPEPAQTRVIAAIDALAENPRPNGIRKMVGSKNLFRIRVGQYRVVYEIHDSILTVLIAAAGNRATIYRLLKRRKR